MQGLINNSEVAGSQLSSSNEKDCDPIYLDAHAVLASLMICSVHAPLYYGNAEFFMNEVLLIVKTALPRLRWFILRFDTIYGVDCAAANRLMELADRLAREQVALVIIELSTDLRGFLSDSGVFEVVALDNVFSSLDSAVAAFKH
jgi:MFS superfamily sulfate permease-like transporter